MRLFTCLFILLLLSCTPSKFKKNPLPEQYTKGEPIIINTLGNNIQQLNRGKISEKLTYNSLYQDTEIIFHTYDSQSLIQKLETDFAMGQAPDIFAVWPDKLISNLIDNEMLLELTPYLNSDQKWFSSFKYGQLWEPVMSNEKIYGLPIEAITENIIINNRIFDEYQLETPETLEDIFSISKELIKHNIIPFDISNWLDLSYLYQALIVMVKSNRPDTNAYIEALYLLIELYDMDAFTLEKILSEKNDYSGSLFVRDRAAMMINGSWLIGRVYTELDGNISLQPLPGLAPAYKKSIIFGLGSMTYYISNIPTRSDNELREIVNYIKFLTSDTTINKTLENIFFLSNIRVDDPNNVIMDNFIKEADVYHSPPDHDFDRDIWNNNILYKIPDILNHNLTPEEIWREVHDAK